MDSVEVFLVQQPYTDQTKGGYRRHLRHFFEWWEKSASEVMPLDFIAFLETKPRWGLSMRYNALVALKAFVRFSHGEKDADGRTREILLLKLRQEEPGEQRTVTREEFAKLEGCLDDSPMDIRTHAMLFLALDARLRSSELVELKVSELNLDRRRLTTRRKGGRQMPGAFTPKTARFVADWLEERKNHAHCEEVFVNLKNGNRRSGLGMQSDHWRYICRRLAIRAGIPHFGPHALCRAFAVISTQNGAPIHLTALAGGWRTLVMVQRYTQALRLDDFEQYLPTSEAPPGT